VWFVIRFRIIQMVLSLSQDVITVAESSSGLKLNIRSTRGIVYELYKLTDGEIEIVEEAITNQVASCGRDYCANSDHSAA